MSQKACVRQSIHHLHLKGVASHPWIFPSEQSFHHVLLIQWLFSTILFGTSVRARIRKLLLPNLEGHSCCSAVWLLAPRRLGLLSPMSTTVPVAPVLMRGVLRRSTCTGTVPPLPYHLVVLVPQHTGKKKRGFVRASGFEASTWSAFPVD